MGFELAAGFEPGSGFELAAGLELNLRSTLSRPAIEGFFSQAIAAPIKGSKDEHQYGADYAVGWFTLALLNAGLAQSKTQRLRRGFSPRCSSAQSPRS